LKPYGLTNVTGFVKQLKPHQDCHSGAPLNLSGSFYYLCSVLDGFSRYVVQWKILGSVKTTNLVLTIQRAVEAFSDVKPTLISDFGSRLFARNMNEFIRLMPMSHIRTSPYYLRSNGNQKRMQGSPNRKWFRERNPPIQKEANRFVRKSFEYYNTKRLNSGTGYVALQHLLEAELKAHRENLNQNYRKHENKGKGTVHRQGWLDQRKCTTYHNHV
jgi:putative transposase